MKKPYEMNRILSTRDKCFNEARGVGGILAKLWRLILADMQMSPSRFEGLLTDYVRTLRKSSFENRVARLFTRGNLRREFEKTSMSFKVFVKGLRLLGVNELKIVVHLKMNSGRVTTHEVTANLGAATHVSEMTEDFVEIPKEVIDSLPKETVDVFVEYMGLDEGDTSNQGEAKLSA